MPIFVWISSRKELLEPYTVLSVSEALRPAGDIFRYRKNGTAGPRQRLQQDQLALHDVRYNRCQIRFYKLTQNFKKFSGRQGGFDQIRGLSLKGCDTPGQHS